MARPSVQWLGRRIGLVLVLIMTIQLFSQLGLVTRRCQPEETKDAEMFKTFKKLTSDDEIQEPEINKKLISDDEIPKPEINKKLTSDDEILKPESHLVQKVEKEAVSKIQKVVDDTLEGKLSIVDKDAIAQELKTLALDLVETQRLTLTLPIFSKIDKHVRNINNILQKLHEKEIVKRASSEKTIFTKNSKNEVCPEKFLGKNLAYGYPYFRTGFAKLNCTNYIPTRKLVTIIISIPKELSKPADSSTDILVNIAKLFPGITVIVATDEALTNLQLKQISELRIKFQHYSSANTKQGRLWQQLLGKVETPYVLIAPDITHFTDDVFLERLVRVVSENDEVVLSGGSYRNLNGEWTMGCLQSSIKNWTLTYKEGYYFSFSDCLVCDFIPGPWLASTNKLKRFGFDESLPDGVFNDLFLRIKKHPRSQIAVSCPDVMFNMQPRVAKDSDYVAVARKHDIKKWVDANGRVRWYGCRRGYAHTGGVTCSLTKGLGVPPCDLANLAEVVKFIMKECEDAGLFCELQEGTLLGAVKFGKVLPWERDADITFLTANYTAFKKLAPKFSKAGYSFSDDDGSLWCCVDGRQAGGKFRIGTTRWTVEMYGQHLMESEILVAKGQKPTKVLFDGQWVNMVRNPGLYARNRYGPNYLRHVEHWMDMGHSTGWSFYKPSKFSPCPYPGHSACLDQYPADGNLQFT